MDLQSVGAHYSGVAENCHCTHMHGAPTHSPTGAHVLRSPFRVVRYSVAGLPSTQLQWLCTGGVSCCMHIRM